MAIKDLNDKVFIFLGGKEFDKNRDGKINYFEWKEMMREKTREHLIEELRKYWEKEKEINTKIEGETKKEEGKKYELAGVIESIRELEEEIIKYRQDHHHWASEKGENADNQYSKELQEWFVDLNDKEEDFIRWIKEEKSQEVENFADPQWLKDKMGTQELSLDELKQEYQRWQEEKDDIKVQIEQPPK